MPESTEIVLNILKLIEDLYLSEISVGFVKFKLINMSCGPHLLCSMSKSCATRYSTKTKQWLLISLTQFITRLDSKLRFLLLCCTFFSQTLTLFSIYAIIPRLKVELHYICTR